MANIFFALSNPTPGREDEFNEWYSNVHVPEVVALDGFASGARYKLSETKVPNLEDSAWGYCAVYNLDGDPSIGVTALTDAIGNGTVLDSDTLDSETVRAWAFEEIASFGGDT